MKLYAKVLESHGKPILSCQIGVDSLLKGLIGKNITIDIKEEKQKRSDEQNKYYWGVVIPAVWRWSRDAGDSYTQQQIHEHLKHSVGKLYNVVEIAGDRVLVNISTSKLSKDEMAAYITRVIVWASENGIDVPEPARFGNLVGA